MNHMDSISFEEPSGVKLQFSVVFDVLISRRRRTTSQRDKTGIRSAFASGIKRLEHFGMHVAKLIIIEAIAGLP